MLRVLVQNVYGFPHPHPLPKEREQDTATTDMTALPLLPARGQAERGQETGKTALTTDERQRLT